MMNNSAKVRNHDVGKADSPISEDSTRDILKPVTLYGFVVPWNDFKGGSHKSDFKLVSTCGFEYFLVADPEWRQILEHHCWEEVKLRGLLNVSNRTVIPQRIFPKGPGGEKNNGVDVDTWKGRELIKKVTKNLIDLVLVPAAVYAVMI